MGKGMKKARKIMEERKNKNVILKIKTKRIKNNGRYE